MLAPPSDVRADLGSSGCCRRFETLQSPATAGARGKVLMHKESWRILGSTVTEGTLTLAFRPHVAMTLGGHWLSCIPSKAATAAAPTTMPAIAPTLTLDDDLREQTVWSSEY